MEDATYKSPTETNCFTKLKSMYRTITVEVVVVFYTLATFASSLATQNLTIDKTCRINLSYNDTICDGIALQNVTMYSDVDEAEVQKQVTIMFAWRDVAQSILPSALLLFFGSWSDRHRNRRPCILLPVIGCAISTIGYLICTYFFYELSAEYCMVADALPVALTGSWFLFYLGVYSYASDVSSEEMRTLRLGAITTLFNVFTTAGAGISGFLYAGLGYYGVFSVCLGMYSVAILYGWFAVEKAGSSEIEAKHDVGFLKDFFDTSHVTDTFKIVFKNPDARKRKRMYVIMILVVVVSGPWYGEAAVMYLFFRYRFQWSEINYSVFSFYGSILHTVATIFSLSFFSKYLKMDDALMGVMSSMSKILAAFIYFFATSGSTFYFGAIIDVFNGTSYIAMRSIISKLVTPDELGKVNSLFGLCEALIPLAYSPMYSLVYKWTIDTFPATFFLFGAALTVPAVLIFLWLYKEHKLDEKHNAQNIHQKEKLLQMEDLSNSKIVKNSEITK